MIVAVASRKGSPGVTTLSALLAAYWYQPGTSRLVLEADPSGGSLAARWSSAHGLTWDPGLLALSTTRRAIVRESLASVAQPVADDLWVAAAPPGSDQVVGGLRRLADTGAAALAGAPDLLTVADCGRLGAASPALPLARRAAVTVVLCRPRLDEVHALIPAVTELVQAGCAPALVCVGDRPYEPAEVAQSLGLELLGTVPHDARAAAAFDTDGFGAGRGLGRSRLVAAVEEIASRIQVRCADLVPSDPTPSPDAPAPVLGQSVAPAQPDRSPSPKPPTSLVPPPTPAPARLDASPEDEVRRIRDRLVASGLEGPFSPATMAARASAATRTASSDRHRVEERSDDG